jgi:hypothetical protein
MPAKTYAEVKWDGRAIEDDKGRLVAVALTRRATVYPVTAGGNRQWRQGETTETEIGTFAVDEIPDAIRELVSWVSYFASSRADQDRPTQN